MCDALCALGSVTDDGITLFGKNSDRPPGEAQDLEWRPARVDRSPVRATHIEVEPLDGVTLGVLGSRPRWMWGYEHGVNEAGLAVGNEAIYTTADPRRAPDALTGMDLVRLVLERSASAADAVETLAELLERYGQGGACVEDGSRRYWSSFLLVDAGRGFHVETTQGAHAVIEVADVCAISNRCSIPTFDAEHGLRAAVLDHSVTPRLDAGRAFLATRPVTWNALQAHLRSHAGGDDGWTVCMHAPADRTTASMIAALPPDGPIVVGAALGSPCASVYVPILVGSPIDGLPRWEEWAVLADVDLDARCEVEQAMWADRVWESGSNAEAIRRLRTALAGA